MRSLELEYKWLGIVPKIYLLSFRVSEQLDAGLLTKNLTDSSTSGFGLIHCNCSTAFKRRPG